MICAGSVICASAAGVLFGKRLPERLMNYLELTLSLLCFLLGISAVQKVSSMIPVALALLSGGTVGEALRLGERTAWAAQRTACSLFGGGGGSEEDTAKRMRQFSCIFCLICISGAGISGSILAATAGDMTFLYVKAMLDLPAAFLFASRLGPVVGLIAVPETVLFAVIYLASSLLSGFFTPDVLGNVYACAGVIMIASAFGIANIKDFKGINLVPALLLVIVFTKVLS